MKHQNGCAGLAQKPQDVNDSACSCTETFRRLICVFIVIMVLAPTLLAQNPQTPPAGGARQPGSRRGRAPRATALAQANAQPAECAGVGTSLVPNS